MSTLGQKRTFRGEQVSGGFRCRHELGAVSGIVDNRRSNMATKIYGAVSPEQQKAMSGLEFVKGLASGALPLNTMAQTLGYDVVEAESGPCRYHGHPDRRSPQSMGYGARRARGHSSR